MIAHMQQLGRALIGGLYSALLLKPREDVFEARLPVCVSLVVLSICALAAFQYALTGGDGWFIPQGLVSAVAASSAVVFYLCVLPFARAGAAPQRLFAGLTAMFVWIFIVCAIGVLIARNFATEMPASGPSLATVGKFAVLLFLLITTFRLGFGLASRARSLVGVGLVVVTFVAGLTFPNAPIFLGRQTKPLEFSLLQGVVDLVRPPLLETPDEDEQAKPRIDVEAVMSGQPDVLSAALTPLLPPRDDRAEYYFLGMAPYAAQDVFKREITAVKALFDDRFGTVGRSLALINHRDTIGDIPLASMSNLDVALRHLGKLMRADRDVLVLFVTSHGSKGEIAVSFPGFPLNELTPDGLAASLDRAGIVNRVLVLSACHSGSFVERLQGDTTLIMAAAHADKTSFGCSNENEWTYFGDAYFNRALRTETSLIDAFGTARDLIVSWEKREKLDASNPQISVGAGIKAKLDAITIKQFGAQSK